MDAQFEALIIGLQRGRQPRTQPLVQRSGAAQGENDLPLLPQHLGMLYDNAPETGREIRVRHELRPQLGYEWCHNGTPLVDALTAQTAAFFLKRAQQRMVQILRQIL